VTNLNSTIYGSLTFVAVFEIMIFLAAAAAFEPRQEAGRFSRDGQMIFLAAAAAFEPNPAFPRPGNEMTGLPVAERRLSRDCLDD
jgi:hypothetical protein